MNKKQKRILKIATLILLVAAVFIIVWFTSKTGEESHRTSQWLAKKIENFIGRHFTIDRRDVFWTSTLNAILRKVGHFVEFFFLGMTAATFLILVFPRKRFSALSAIALCALTALLDEFRQSFVAGRTPQWLDVKLDMVGSLCGITLVFIIWIIYSKMMRYKNRIKELEDFIKSHHLEE
jgi:VanZ family protein